VPVLANRQHISPRCYKGTGHRRRCDRRVGGGQFVGGGAVYVPACDTGKTVEHSLGIHSCLGREDESLRHGGNIQRHDDLVRHFRGLAVAGAADRWKGGAGWQLGAAGDRFDDFWKRVSWRAGAYGIVGGADNLITEAITAGMGMPLGSMGTLDLSLQLGQNQVDNGGPGMDCKILPRPLGKVALPDVCFDAAK